MKRYLATFIRCILCVVFIAPGTGPAGAAEDIIVRLTPEPQEPWIGQKVVLMLDVLGLDGWAQLQSTGDIEIKGGYLQRLETQGTRLNETINGASYSGQRYEYFLFPQRAGKITIPSIDVVAEIKQWGADSKSVTKRAATEPVTLEARQPPGILPADQLISAPDFSAAQNWKPEPKKLSVGDSVSREIVLKASDLSGMAFAPMTEVQTEGVATYPSEPQVQNNYDRGTLTGKRIEKITYIMEQKGAVSLPAVAYVWWNTKSEKLTRISLPGASFEVTANVGDTHTAPAETRSYKPGRTFIASLLAVVLIVSALLIYSLPVLRRFIHHKKMGWKTSEKYLFRQIAQASRLNSPRLILNATMRWLDTISNETVPARLDLFLEQYGEIESKAIITRFTDPSGPDTDARKVTLLYEELIKARSRWLRSQKRRHTEDQVLPPVGFLGQQP